MNFTLNNNIDLTGTSFRDYYLCAPTDLFETFGEPALDDEYKVSLSYCFIDDADFVYTLYDWKATSLYSSGLEHPCDFRDSAYNYKFHIGTIPEHDGGPSQERINAFKLWLDTETSDIPEKAMKYCISCNTIIRNGDKIIPVLEANYEFIKGNYREPAFWQFRTEIRTTTYKHLRCM
tara:strand:+ start:209 stop:739 length:531 start_codon:yes stop_codon:yes gene_type:complete